MNFTMPQRLSYFIGICLISVFVVGAAMKQSDAQSEIHASEQKESRIEAIDSFLTVISSPGNTTQGRLAQFFSVSSESELPFLEQLDFPEHEDSKKIYCNECLSYFLVIKQLEIARKCGGFSKMKPYTIHFLSAKSPIYRIYRVTFPNDSILDFYMDDRNDHIIHAIN